MLAQEEARDLNHAFIGTEHILLGLIREGEGVAAKALDALGVTFDVVREKVEEAIGANTNPSPGIAAVHAAREEGPRALAARSPATRPLLHRHRAHAARAGARGRRRRGPGPERPRRRHGAGAHPGDPDDVRPGRQGVGRLEPVRRPEERRRRGRRRFGRPGPVRSQPHAVRPRGQARPARRAREGSRARDAGAVTTHQEQPRPDRRARRRQDRDRRGPRPEDRRQPGAGHARRQAALHPRPRRARRGQPLPR